MKNKLGKFALVQERAKYWMGQFQTIFVIWTLIEVLDRFPIVEFAVMGISFLVVLYLDLHRKGIYSRVLEMSTSYNPYFVRMDEGIKEILKEVKKKGE